MFSRKHTLVSFVFGALVVSSACAADLPRARPEELGFSAERLAYLDRFYAEQVNRGELAGIVTLIARHGKIAHFSAIGYSDLDKKQKMQPDTIFRLYSMSKPITSAALMILYEEGRFQMSDPITKYIPELSGLRVLRNPDGPFDDTVPMRRPPTIQDLLRHTGGFTHCLLTLPGGFDTQCTDVFGLDISLEQMINRLAKIPLRHQPGSKFEYSLAPDIQARLVEILSGLPFDQFLKQRLFQPLGMKDAGFFVPRAQANRLAAVTWTRDGRLMPIDAQHGHPGNVVLYEPWAVNGYSANHRQKSGSVGLVSTAEDYWRFAQMLLNGGELEGKRVLSPRVVDFMTRDQLGSLEFDIPGSGILGTGFGLGVAVIKDSPAAALVSSEGSFFWQGLAGTIFWVDPQADMVVVAMIQHFGPGTTMRPQIRTLVYSAMLN